MARLQKKKGDDPAHLRSQTQEEEDNPHEKVSEASARLSRERVAQQLERVTEDQKIAHSETPAEETALVAGLRLRSYALTLAGIQQIGACNVT